MIPMSTGTHNIRLSERLRNKKNRNLDYLILGYVNLIINKANLLIVYIDAC